MDPDRSDVRRSADTAATFLLWLAVFATLFISALGALFAICSILIYGGTIIGYFQLVEGTPQYDIFQAIQRNPASRLALVGFNLVLWVSVLIGATYLLRLREWARVFIKTLLAIDLFVTLGVALWPAIGQWLYKRPIQTQVTVDLLITTVEVLIILVLSHPRVIALTDTHRGQGGDIRQMTGLPERRPDGRE